MNSPDFSKPRGRHCWVCASLMLLSGSVFADANARAQEAIAGGSDAAERATDTLRPEERAFLVKASELSAQQTRLARLAVAQASSSDVRAFAQQVAADLQQLTESVDALRRRKGSTVAAANQEIVSESYQNLLERTGDGFDREFVRILGDSHATLLTVFERATEDAKDLEVRDLAGGALPTLREHGNVITELRKVFE
jgi:putative membrane protein